MINGQLIIFGNNNSYYVYTPKIFIDNEYKPTKSYIYTNGKWNLCFVKQFDSSILGSSEKDDLFDSNNFILMEKPQSATQSHKLELLDNQSIDIITSDGEKVYLYDPVK